jgi:hypothetical protein
VSFVQRSALPQRERTAGRHRLLSTVLAVTPHALPWNGAIAERMARQYDARMQSPHENQGLAAARASLAHRVTFAEFLAKLPGKDRAAAERRVATLAAAGDAQRAALWQRLACSLVTLAPHAAKLVGKQTLQVYVADGARFRRQVFALEDLQDGNFTVYCPDVLDEVVKAGLLTRDPAGGGDGYVTGPGAPPLRIERLDGRKLAAAHVKELTGWNRKALQITLPPAPSEAQVEAAELLCATAAQHFTSVAPPAGAP